MVVKSWPSCPGQWWRHIPGGFKRCLDFSGSWVHGVGVSLVARSMVWLDDLQGLFQSKQFCTIIPQTHWICGQFLKLVRQREISCCPQPLVLQMKWVFPTWGNSSLFKKGVRTLRAVGDLKLFLLNTNRYLGSHHFQERKGSAQSHERGKMSRDSFCTINKAQFRKSAHADQSLQHSALNPLCTSVSGPQHPETHLLIPQNHLVWHNSPAGFPPGVFFVYKHGADLSPCPPSCPSPSHLRIFQRVLCLSEQAVLSERLQFSSPDKVMTSWVKIPTPASPSCREDLHSVTNDDQSFPWASSKLSGWQCVFWTGACSFCLAIQTQEKN